MQPGHAPQLCRKSLELAEQSNVKSILERSQSEPKRAEHTALTRRSEVHRDPNCTFRPKINPTSKLLAPRSFDDLSVGDALKRETNQRLKRLQAEQQEMAELTFRPKLLSKNRYVLFVWVRAVAAVTPIAMQLSLNRLGAATQCQRPFDFLIVNTVFYCSTHTLLWGLQAFTRTSADHART